MADLYSEFDVQKCLQGKDVKIIQARTILVGFKVKIDQFKASLSRRDFKFFSNLQQLQESGSLSDVDLEMYTKRLDKLREDFKGYFEDLEKMHVPDYS